MTTSEEIPSVKMAVAREARRRKRVFAIFLALLAVPLVIGLYAIVKAPSETDVVVKRVTPIIEKNVEENVTRRVDERIEPRVEEVVARRATPIIQQTLDKQLDVQLDRAVVARVQPLQQEFREFTREGNPQQMRMSARVKELEARVAALEKRLETMSGRVPITHVPTPQP